MLQSSVLRYVTLKPQNNQTAKAEPQNSQTLRASRSSTRLGGDYSATILALYSDTDTSSPDLYVNLKACSYAYCCPLPTRKMSAEDDAAWPHLHWAPLL